MWRGERDTTGGVKNLRWWSRAERYALAWRAKGMDMRAEYGDSDDDTDEEYDADTGELIDDVESNLLSAKAKAAKTERETRATTAVVHDAVVASVGLPTRLVYRDGG